MDTTHVGYSYNLPSNGWNCKIRNTLSQFSELFSEFNKYLAPAYHHDRCERSVPMRVYSMPKGEFVMVIIGFFAFFGLAIFIGFAGPQPTTQVEVLGTNVLGNNSRLYDGPYHIHSQTLSNRMQQLWLYMHIVTENNDVEIFDKRFQISIIVEGLTSEHNSVTLYPHHKLNRTLHLACWSRSCDSIMILHIGTLEYTHYIFNIYLYGLKEFHNRYTIAQTFFYIKTYSAAFTQIETWFRFIFLITTFAITCWFIHSMRKYSTCDWSIEQKWLSLLLPSLLLYNDPLFPLRLVSSSCIAGLFDTIFQVVHLSLLAICFPCLYHGFRQNERGFFSFYMPKIIVVSLMFVPSLIITFWQKYYSFYDPTYNYTLESDYVTVKYVFYSGLCLYIVYLLILIIRTYTDLKNMPYFDLRLNCVSIMLTTLGIVTLWLYRYNWTPSPARDTIHYWDSTDTRSNPATSATFMAQCALFNLQLYTWVYLYTPANLQPQDNIITKDNPAFSMINDSDEDVIYGSDEESRRPLTASKSNSIQM